MIARVLGWIRWNVTGIIGFCAVSAWWLFVGVVVSCWLRGAP